MVEVRDEGSALVPAHNAAALSALTLPIYDEADALLAAVRAHQVIVVEGATGSGKTTQIPRILYHSGLTDRIIGVTQPRRIAATSVAHRIAVEEGVTLPDERGKEERRSSTGSHVGYCIRFDDRSDHNTRIKVMTDGILLEEARGDPDFDAYGVLMIDEAHERTLNIDVTLGLLGRALKRRADLRVVISSATLDPELFVRFFAHLGMEVPTIHINARPHPVEIVYRPPALTHDRNELVWAACNEIERICRGREPGHVLCFFSGEGPIVRAAQELTRRRMERFARILPLYGALQREEQEQVFAEFGKRKVVLATNLAETSITIPDVRFVVDGGVAKVPRVDAHTGIRTLAEEPVAQANCDQRAGRAGRTAPGVAIRLYSREDFERRPRFVDVEILRLDLREVVLRIIDLNIRDVEDFELPTRPSTERLRAALKWLQRMGLIDEANNLTEIGRLVTPFPLTPALGMMVVHAAQHHPKALDDVLLVAAFLSARRPMLYPVGEENEAKAAQTTFLDPRADVLTMLRLNDAWRRANDKRRFCVNSYVDGNVMAFVAHAHDQLRDIAGKLGLIGEHGGPRGTHEKMDAESVVRSFAAGFRDQLLVADGRAYSTRTTGKISVHPGSACTGTEARFLVAGEIIVLARTYASQVAVLKPDWIAELDGELADRLNLRQRREEKKGKPAKNTMPDSVTIRGATLPIVTRRGRVQVDVPYEALGLLREVGRQDFIGLDPRVLDLKARILVDGDAWAAGTPLRALLEQLDDLPIPPPGTDLSCTVPDGVLFEADRNLHGLMRHLPTLLKPMRPSRGKQPGWLALVGNGAGGFWFEVMHAWPDTVEATDDAMTQLAAALDDTDPAVFDVERESRRIDKVALAVAEARKQRRGRRQ